MANRSDLSVKEDTSLKKILLKLMSSTHVKMALTGILKIAEDILMFLLMKKIGQGV